jgi:hypothetical protein
MPSIFERKNAADHSAEKQERRTSHLERKIGQLLIEKEFLEKKCDQLGIEVDTDGSYALVLWLPLSTTEPVSVEVGGRKGGGHCSTGISIWKEVEPQVRLSNSIKIYEDSTVTHSFHPRCIKPLTR